MKQIEIRFAELDGGGTEFDEILASSAGVHLEKMNDSTFALIIETRHERACFLIFTKNGRAHIDAATSWHEPINRRSEAQKRRWNALTPEQRRHQRRAHKVRRGEAVPK